MSERYPRERSTDKEILVTKPYKTSPLIEPGAIYKQYVSNGRQQHKGIQYSSHVQWEADF